MHKIVYALLLLAITPLSAMEYYDRKGKAPAHDTLEDDIYGSSINALTKKECAEYDDDTDEYDSDNRVVHNPIHSPEKITSIIRPRTEAQKDFMWRKKKRKLTFKPYDSTPEIPQDDDWISQLLESPVASPSPKLEDWNSSSEIEDQKPQ